jgi:tetratricopeptide (TPR) repeat protein
MQPSVADINKYMTSGDKSFSAGDFNASQIAYEQAFQMAKKVGEETLENQAFEKHLKSLLELGKYTDLTNESLQEQKAPLAIDLLKSCLAEIRAKYGDKSLAEADCLYALASLYEKSGDYDQAEKYFSQSLQIKSAASGVATSKPAGTEKEPASAQTVATKEIEEHIASVKKQKANVKARKPVRKAVTRVPAKKETRKEASTKSDKDADGDKRGFFGSIGHGVKKVFGVFGHHKKEK